MRLRLHRSLKLPGRMAPRRWPGRTGPIASGLGLVLVLGTVLILVVRNDDAAPADFGSRVPGQRIYDQTGLLTSSDLMTLDRRAAAIERSGVPVVVYVRPAGPDVIDTRSDARALMRSWDVESGPGAADGLVLLLDVDWLDANPDRVALIPGDRLKDNRLPIGETERIAAGSVWGPTTGVDASGELAATIEFSLTATERRLLLGLPSAPSPSTAERTAATFVRYLMPVVSAVLALLAAIVIGAIWRGRPRPAGGARCDLSQPGPGSSVLRAALAANQIDQSVVVAAVRHLDGLGSVAIPSVEGAAIASHLPDRVQLVDRDRAVDEIDRAAWDELAMVSVDGVVDWHGLTLISHRGGRFSQTITAELERRGWWDTVSPRRAVPLLMMSRGLLLAGGVTLVISLAVGEVWGVFAIATLTLTAAIAWACAQAYPRATPLGLAIAEQSATADGG